ncbi:MAG: mycofactocin-coupled SDR family oxidoreductase [Actinobacteria bacterium]|nr:mycofactocin-coupled SDR family oxidoreductase [Actinomycetota bacterium]
MGKLDGKVAYITGAGRGQGRAHALRLAEEGADIIATDICADITSIDYGLATKDDLDETGARVRELDRRVYLAVADVRDREGVTAAANRGAAELGGIDIVCANAGICTMKPWDETTDEIWNDQIDTILTGTWNTLKATVPHLLERGSGSIIITASVAGARGNPYLAAYGAAKHGVIGLAKTMANELGMHNIRVNCISPNGVNTGLLEGLGGFEELMAKGPHFAPLFTNALPIEMAEARDISEGVLFLASDEGRFMTGHNLLMDMGNMLR